VAERILLVFSDKATLHLLERSILAPEGYQVLAVQTCQEAEKIYRSGNPDLVILGDKLPDGHYLDLATRMVNDKPTLPIILFTAEKSESLPLRVLRLGVVDWLTPPILAADVLEAVRRGLDRRTHWRNWLQVETSRYTGPLEQRVEFLETLVNVGRSVTSFLDLNTVLKTVVDAAVELTGAEEGSILLLNEESGQLEMQAARNFQEEFVRTFSVPVNDSLAGEVLTSGRPLTIDTKDPQKIKTSYLVYSLVYVPLQIHDRTIGVLGVDNRQKRLSFNSQDVMVLTALADYAAIAIDNARLFADTLLERNKLERILTQIRDGVIVIDPDGKIVLLNRQARRIFSLSEEEYSSKDIQDVIKNKGLMDAIQGNVEDPLRIEIEVEGVGFFNVQVTDVPDIGQVATLHDINYLKELDRIKSDFVHAVSHDLRSPLTAILGYVDLINRAGPVNDRQSEFISRVRFSVKSITTLIDGLLKLTRVEVDLNQDMEAVSIKDIIDLAVEGVNHMIAEKRQELIIDCEDNLPLIVANHIQLRQVYDNLLGNASKYTPEGGTIRIKAREEEDQIITQVIDTGYGIPPEDQPMIFDKFYRASNAPQDIHGTGLGLAIVKTVVEAHNGRVWVNSKLGEGTTFYVVLPVGHTNNLQ
jgi:two-component system NtrC family sensor kinase